MPRQQTPESNVCVINENVSVSPNCLSVFCIRPLGILWHGTFPRTQQRNKAINDDGACIFVLSLRPILQNGATLDPSPDENNTKPLYCVKLAKHQSRAEILPICAGIHPASNFREEAICITPPPRRSGTAGGARPATSTTTTSCRRIERQQTRTIMQRLDNGPPSTRSFALPLGIARTELNTYHLEATSVLDSETLYT